MGTDVEMRAAEAVTARAMRSPAAGIALWALKTAALWVALLAGSMAAFKLVPIDLPAPKEDGPLTVMQAFLMVNGLIAVALSFVAVRARVADWRLGVLLFVAFFAIGSVMMQIETLYFNDSLKLPLAAIFALVEQAAIVGAVVALVGALLFRHADETIMPVPSGLAGRVILLAVVYVFLYYGAGFFIAWQSEAVRTYYDNGAHIALLPTIALQLVRGTLWALIALFIVTRLGGSLACRAGIMGVLFAVLTAAQLLYPTPHFPWAVREAHLLEVGSSEFVYGIVATLILLAGAARRPLSATSSWRLIAGHA